MVAPKTQASKMYRSSVTNGMQNTVISRSDMTKFIVERFEEFLLFDENRITIRMGMFPASEISAIKNSDATMRSRSPLVNRQRNKIQS